MAQAFQPTQSTSSALQYNLSTYFDDLLLVQAKQKLVLYNLIEKKPLPKGSGNVVKWTRYTLLGAVAAATEGTAPTPTALSSANVTGTLVQFTGSTITTDVLEMTAIDNQIASAVEQLSYQAVITIDKYIRDAALGNTGSVSTDEAANQATRVAAANNSFVYWMGASGATYGTAMSGLTTSNIPMTVNNLTDVQGYLNTLNAPTMDDGFYYGVMHPRVEAQLKTDTTAVVSWSAWNNSTQGGQGKMEQGFIGNMAGIKFWRSTNMWFHTSGTGTVGTVSAHHTLIFGKGALGIVDIDGGVKTYITTGADSNNPAAQWSTIAWKITTAARVLNPSFGVVVITGA